MPLQIMAGLQTFTYTRPLNTAVLFLIFNRLETTKRVFKTIQQAKPPRFYVAADGYRSHCKGEEEKVLEVRNYILNNINWNCEVKTLFRDRNMGCGAAVSSAIDWFFKYEETGIILEDDVMPDPSFFQFCEELLERYKNEPQIMIISGDYFAGEKHRPKASYYFSQYPHIWGWATWRRAWKGYDRLMTKWPQLKLTNFLSQLDNGNKHFMNYWSRIFDMIHDGRLDTWDYQLIFACWVNHSLSIMPSKNLVKNIGFGTEATKTFQKNHWITKLPLQHIEFPLIHPENIERNIAADRWCSRYVFEINFVSSLKSWIIRQPGGNFMTKIYRLFKRYLRK